MYKYCVLKTHNLNLLLSLLLSPSSLKISAIATPWVVSYSLRPLSCAAAFPTERRVGQKAELGFKFCTPFTASTWPHKVMTLRSTQKSESCTCMTWEFALRLFLSHIITVVWNAIFHGIRLYYSQQQRSCTGWGPTNKTSAQHTHVYLSMLYILHEGIFDLPCYDEHTSFLCHAYDEGPHLW